jgi:hypothetical protein
VADFNRYRILGFDLRRRPLLDLGGPKKLGDYWPTDWPKPFPYPATISSQTWLRSEACENFEHPLLNSANLLWLPDAQYLDGKSISVAFSMRVADVASFEKEGWYLHIDEGFLDVSLGWRLLGYDVVDSYLCFSAFYGFTWKEGELASILADQDVTFNRRGLLDREADAERLTQLFSLDEGTASHRPFYPVRVWAQMNE